MLCSRCSPRLIVIVATICALLGGAWSLLEAQRERGRRWDSPANFPLYRSDLASRPHTYTAKIRNSMIQVRSVQVPKRASHLALLKWQRQLLESDNFLMTHAFTVLEGQPHDPQQVAFHLNKLRTNFEAIRRLPAEDHPIRPQCETYLAALEDLAQSLHR